MESKSNNLKVFGIVSVAVVIVLVIVLTFVFRGDGGEAEPASTDETAIEQNPTEEDEQNQAEETPVDDDKGEETTDSRADVSDTTTPIDSDLEASNLAEPVLEDFDSILTALNTYIINNNARAPQETGSVVDLENIFGSISWQHYSPENVFYFGSDFDADDDNEEFAAAANSLDSSTIHIWGRRVCKAEFTPVGGDPAELATAGTRGSLAFSTLPDGLAHFYCSDNNS